MPVAIGAAVGGLLWRLAIFTLLWWILTDGRADALVFGIAFIVIAALLSSAFKDKRQGTNAPARVALPALARLIPFFVYHSLSGGVDVAIRAFKRPLPLTPDLVDYPLRLPAGPATVLMAGLVSLMPGTLAVIGEGRLRVHVLDRSSDFWRELQTLERHVGAVFGLRLPDSEEEPEGVGGTLANPAKPPPQPVPQPTQDRESNG
jgi:multicomponent Na+:H+ antiporter subunit E